MREKLRTESELFVIGSLGYGLLEILWRGFTHWTMVLTGGACFLGIYHLDGKYARRPLLSKGLMGSALITAAEFTVGCIVNVWLRWDVWDYSRLPCNFLGQICLRYSLLWYGLSLPLFWLCGKLRRFFAGGRASGRRLLRSGAFGSGTASRRVERLESSSSFEL